MRKKFSDESRKIIPIKLSSSVDPFHFDLDPDPFREITDPVPDPKKLNTEIIFCLLIMSLLFMCRKQKVISFKTNMIFL